jgi:TatD DNase family protein
MHPRIVGFNHHPTQSSYNGPMELIDSHCHIDVHEFDPDREHVITRSRLAGVTRLIVPAVDAAGWDNLLTLCNTVHGLYPTLGLHPIYLDNHRDEHIDELKTRIANKRPIAIGEIGLDYFISELDRTRQQSIFETQLRIARDADLPVILHTRKSHDPVLATLRRIRVRGGIAHAFNGSPQQAQQFIDLGFLLGFGGTITYSRANRIRSLARNVPIEAIALETDAPDIPLSTHRGERNSPEYLPECLCELALLRDAKPEDLAQQTTANVMRVFALGA